MQIYYNNINFKKNYLRRSVIAERDGYYGEIKTATECKKYFRIKPETDLEYFTVLQKFKLSQLRKCFIPKLYDIVL